MSFLSRWWRHRSCPAIPTSLPTANCLCWSSKDHHHEIDDESLHNPKSTMKGISWLDETDDDSTIPRTSQESSLLAITAASMSSQKGKAKPTTRPPADDILMDWQKREQCLTRVAAESAASTIEEEEEAISSSSPELPLQILVEMIAPFLSDRTSLTRFSMASKEIYRECRESILYPPWPNTMLNLRCRLWAVTFSPDNQTLAVGGTDGRIRLFDRRRGPTEVLTGHLGRVYSIVFTKEGTTMVTLSGDGDLRIWNVAVSGERTNDAADDTNVAEEDEDEPPYALRRQVPTHTTHAVCLAYNNVTMKLATGGEGDIKLYSIPQGIGLDVLTMERTRFLVESVTFSPNGAFMAVGTGGHTIHIWDLALRQCVTTFQESSCVHALEYSPDGQYLVAGTDDSDIRVWNMMTGDYVTLKGHRDLVWSVAYSPDGKHIASAGDDGTVRMWNVASGLCTDIWNGHEGSSVYNVAFSPDGRTIASTSNDGYLELRRTRRAVFSTG